MVTRSPKSASKLPGNLVRSVLALQVLRYSRCQIRKQVVGEIISIIGSQTLYNKCSKHETARHGGHANVHVVDCKRIMRTLPLCKSIKFLALQVHVCDMVSTSSLQLSSGALHYLLACHEIRQRDLAPAAVIMYCPLLLQSTEASATANPSIGGECADATHTCSRIIGRR